MESKSVRAKIQTRFQSQTQQVEKGPGIFCDSSMHFFSPTVPRKVVYKGEHLKHCLNWIL